jgi:hypothetical protein
VGFLAIKKKKKTEKKKKKTKNEMQISKLKNEAHFY